MASAKEAPLRLEEDLSKMGREDVDTFVVVLGRSIRRVSIRSAARFLSIASHAPLFTARGLRACTEFSQQARGET